MPAVGAGEASTISGTVAETLPAGSYTYVRVHTADGADVWAAARGDAPALGSAASFSTEMRMVNFHSDSLARDFELVYFVRSIAPSSTSSGAAPAGVRSPAVGPAAVRPPATGPDTVTMAALIADPSKFVGQKVSITGDVTRSTSGVLGRNWLHIRGAAGEDLTVTSSETAAIGEHLQVTGTVAVKQDFGSGYSYPVMLTDAVFAAG
ncbi:MAG: hypothetical protein EXR69_04135 [Myxococcales bacterium]|nr:hypothetical protein [Myxococcales bacterium]